jgi:hypothetical protein
MLSRLQAVPQRTSRTSFTSCTCQPRAYSHLSHLFNPLFLSPLRSSRSSRLTLCSLCAPQCPLCYFFMPPANPSRLKTSKPRAIPNDSIKPPQKAPPFQLFHFVPLCSAEKFSCRTAEHPFFRPVHESMRFNPRPFEQIRSCKPQNPRHSHVLNFVTPCYALLRFLFFAPHAARHPSAPKPP